MNDKNKYTYEIKEHLGTTSTSPKGQSTELNLVSWNDAPARYELRTWSPDHKRFGRGIRLNEEDLLILLQILKDRLGDES